MSAARPIAALLAAAILSCTAAAQEKAGPRAKSRPPVAAVLNLDRSAEGLLLESRLRREEPLRWWPRGKTAQLLNSAALSTRLDLPSLDRDEADSGARLQTLILVKTFHRKQQEFLQVVVCDIERGLRLALYRAQVSETGAEIEALAAGIARLLASRPPLREVWAVPPLLSRDLTHDFDDSAGQFAEEIENVFLSRDGAAVVEFEFASSIDSARRAAGIIGPLKRPLAAYVLGEYRNEGHGEKRTIGLTLKLFRGEREELDRRLDPASPDRALELAIAFANDAAAKLKGAELLTDEQSAEEGVLIKRMTALEQAGDWAGAWYLAEALLLLQPNRSELRSKAISALDKIAVRQRGLGEQWVQQSSRELANRTATAADRRTTESLLTEALERATAALNLHRRAVQHIHLALDGDEASRKTWLTRGASAAVSSSTALGRPVELLNADPDRRLPSLWGQVLLDHRSALARMFFEGAKLGQTQPPYYLQGLSVEEHLNEALRAIILTQDLPNARQRSASIVSSAVSRGYSRRADLDRFIAQLNAIGSPATKAAAAAAKSQLAALSAARTRPPVARPPEVAKADEPSEPAQIEFEEIKLPFKPVGSAASPAYGQCQLCLAAGKADLFFGNGQLLMMKHKGEATKIWEDADTQWFVRSAPTPGLPMVCFDGRYAWIPLSRTGKPQRLLMIDVENEKVIEWTGDDGLPLEAAEPGRSTAAMLGVTPLAQGKVCIAGSSGRGWLATAQYDAEKGKSAKVFFEARDEGRPTDPREAQKATLAFRPEYIYMLEGELEGKDRCQRVLVGRTTATTGSSSQPLLVDPESGAVEVLPTPLNMFAVASAARRGDEIYWLASEYAFDMAEQKQKVKTGVFRLGFPDFQKHLVIDYGQLPIRQTTNLGFDDRGLHFVGNPWFTAPAPDKPLTRLRGKLPEIRVTYTTAGNVMSTSVLNQWQLAPSSHYGWLIHQVGRVYAVKFKDGEPKTAAPPAEKE